MPRVKRTPRKDGRFVCRYQNKYFYGDTQREAEQKRDAYKRMIAEGIRAESSGLTVRAYAGRWIATHKATVSTKCYNDYVKQLNAMIAIIGNYRLMDVTPDDIKGIFSTHYKDYSDSTIHRAKMLYTAMFDAAVENGYARYNPCRSKHAAPHKGTSGTHRCITNEERALIMHTPHRFRLAAMVMLYAGLRRGEVLALRGTDIYDGFIHVERAVRYESNQPILDDPKTEAGRREVPLLSVLQKELGDTSGLIATDTFGRLCSQVATRNAWRSYNKALSMAAGHEINIRMHDLRHSYCTMLRDRGVDLELAMKWMGHSDEKMILKIYSHITDERIEKAIETIEKKDACCQNGCQRDVETNECLDL